MAIVSFILLAGSEDSAETRLLSSPGIIALLLVVLSAQVINSIILLRSRSNLIRSGTRFELLEDTFSKLEELNRTLRSQRHDFMNHLQVVYSLMEMDEFPDAKEYIEKVFNDIQKVSRIMKTSNPAVNALLQAKIIKCEKMGVNVELHVTSQLRDLRIPPWEYCRILGNVLDNSIYALGEKNTDMYIKIEIYEDIKNYFFKVSDNGGGIPPNHYEKIFEPGFTTKDEKGEGMGLYISREILQKYGGSIKVSSIDGMTVFDVGVPR